MADEDKGEAAKPKKRGKLKLIAGGLLLLSGGVGGGLYAASKFGTHAPAEDPRRPKLVLRGEGGEPAAGGEKEGKEAARRVGTVAVSGDTAKVDPRRYEVAYYPIEQSFTANLADGGGFAQIGISLATYYDSRVGDAIARQTVPIRSAVLMVLSDQQAAALTTPEGKRALQRQLTQAINGVLREKEGFGGIDNVYFTSLVVQ